MGWFQPSAHEEKLRVGFESGRVVVCLTEREIINAPALNRDPSGAPPIKEGVAPPPALSCDPIVEQPFLSDPLLRHSQLTLPFSFTLPLSSSACGFYFIFPFISWGGPLSFPSPNSNFGPHPTAVLVCLPFHSNPINPSVLLPGTLCDLHTDTSPLVTHNPSLVYPLIGSLSVNHLQVLSAEPLPKPIALQSPGDSACCRKGILGKGNPVRFAPLHILFPLQNRKHVTAARCGGVCPWSPFPPKSPSSHKSPVICLASIVPLLSLGVLTA